MRQILNTPANIAKEYSYFEYLTPPHIETLDTLLCQMFHGDVSRLIVNMPPRHGKSELISKYLPVWWLLNRPHDKILLVTYAAEFATTWTLQARELYAMVGRKPVISKQNYFQTRQGGSFFATGIDGQLTGKGFDLVIIDDPVKNAEDASSARLRDKAWNWYVSTLMTRFTRNTKLIVVQTRWHLDDLTGRIIANDKQEKFRRVIFPAIDENNNPLWEERFNLEELLDIKETLGSYFFSALYQQTPLASDNIIVKPEWFQYYNHEITHYDMFIRSWDTALEDKTQNDYTVCSEWYLVGDELYLHNIHRAKMQFPDLVATANLLNDQKPADLDIVEDSTPGKSFIQHMIENSSMAVKAIKPLGSKQLRLNIAAATFEAKKIFIKEAEWNYDFEKEMLEFPNSKHDDIVDSITQAVLYLNKQRRGSSSLEYLKLDNNKKDYFNNTNWI